MDDRVAKSFEGIDFNQDQRFQKTVYPVGMIRTWEHTRYQKQNDGTWKPLKDEEDDKVEQARQEFNSKETKKPNFNSDDYYKEVTSRVKTQVDGFANEIYSDIKNNKVTIAVAMKNFRDKHPDEGTGSLSLYRQKALELADKEESKPTVPSQIFDINSAAEAVETLKSSINTPVVNVHSSTLGGEKNVSIAIKVSLDPKEEWRHGIYHNSRYSIFYLDNKGTLEQTHRNRSGGTGKFIKRKVRSMKDAVEKINKWASSHKED